MRPRPAFVLTALAAAGSWPAAASAAEISVDRACYADPTDRPETVNLRGDGFAPNAPYRVLLDGEPLEGGSGVTDQDGRMSGRFVAPSVRTASQVARQHKFDLRVEQDGLQPAVYFTVSRLFASFQPTGGDPRKLRVRFSAYGFSLLGEKKPPIYLHYVSPRGRLARTVRVGRGTGACGFRRTKRLRLFPFTPLRGSWRLQFDTRRGYTQGTSRSSFLFFKARVRVR